MDIFVLEKKLNYHEKNADNVIVLEIPTSLMTQ